MFDASQDSIRLQNRHGKEVDVQQLAEKLKQGFGDGNLCTR